jgi:DNA-binding NarL/FixJ family response regulator
MPGSDTATRSGAICLAQSDDPADRRVAHALLTALSATATLQAAQREWLRRGLPVPRGPRPVNGDAQGLTAQELEVPELLGEGLRNSEIADRLVLSEKTVAHHVSAVLRKLAVPTRARATSRARQLGILTTSTDPASWAARPM